MPGHPLALRPHVLGLWGFNDLKQQGLGNKRPHVEVLPMWRVVAELTGLIQVDSCQ